MPSPPLSFPKCVCWQESTRPAVFNTVALRVVDAVFNATHTHIPLQMRDPISREPIGVLSEQDFLNKLIAQNTKHMFCVVGGLPGTGKSHLVKWIDRQLDASVRDRSDDMHVVLVPRDSANLADVLSKIMDGFEGENIDRIRQEIQGSSNLTETGYMTHVLDQLAFTVDPENQASTNLDFPCDEDHEIILSCLPPMLRDQAIRGHLMEDTAKGIVSRLTQHVFGERKERPDKAGKCEWAPSDLKFEPKVTKGAGAAAREMGTALYSDDKLREKTAAVLNKALNEAVPRLVGLRMGSLKEAFFEIRQELKKRKKKLVLLIEDLSVTQGLDAELIEALQVTPADGGDKLCELRSVVGVTPDDLNFLYENIRERIDIAVELKMPIDDEHLGLEFLFSFAAKYLNAARYDMADLENWDASRTQDESLPSFCQAAECPNLKACHADFGAVDGCGLYPFSKTALERLYTSHRGTASEEGSVAKAFNPRALVGPVMGKFHEHAEQSISHGDFPSKSLLDRFRLLPGQGSRKRLPAQRQDELDQEYGEAGSRRVQGLIEIYSNDPTLGKADKSIGKHLDIKLQAGDSVAPDVDRRVTPQPGDTIQPAPLPTGPDDFEIWANTKTVPQRLLTSWRKALYEAIKGSHDWDSDEFGWLFDSGLFSASNIEFEGQATSTRTKGVPLKVKSTARHTRAMRALLNSSGARDEAGLICVCELLEDQVADLQKKFEKISSTPSSNDPLEKALEIALVNAAVHGVDISSLKSDSDLLDAIFQDSPESFPENEVEQVGAFPPNRTWAQARKAFDPQEFNTFREWLRKRVVATKGARTGAGFLRVHTVLERLAKAKKSTKSLLSDIDTSRWDKDVYSPIIQFLSGKASKVKTGLEIQAKELKGWNTKAQALLGEKISLKRLESICSDIRGGIDSDVIQAHDASELLECVETNAPDFCDAAEHVQALLENKNPLQRLAALGNLDFPLINTVLNTLTQLDAIVASAEEKAGQDLAEAEQQNTDDLTKKLDKELTRLYEALENLNE